MEWATRYIYDNLKLSNINNCHVCDNSIRTAKEWDWEDQYRPGLPRPTLNAGGSGSSHAEVMADTEGLLVHKINPVPFGWIPSDDPEGPVPTTGRKIPSHITIPNHLCPWCGVKFEDSNRIVARWKLPNHHEGNAFFPFHTRCMRQHRIFCGGARIAKDSDFEIGPYHELRRRAEEQSSEVGTPEEKFVDFFRSAGVREAGMVDPGSLGPCTGTGCKTCAHYDDLIGGLTKSSETQKPTAANRAKAQELKSHKTRHKKARGTKKASKCTCEDIPATAQEHTQRAIELIRRKSQQGLDVSEPDEHIDHHFSMGAGVKEAGAGIYCPWCGDHHPSVKTAMPEWTPENADDEGPVRPFFKTSPGSHRDNPTNPVSKNGLWLHQRVPIPWDAEPQELEEGQEGGLESDQPLMGESIAPGTKVRRALDEHRCPHCKRQFDDNETVVAWKEFMPGLSSNRLPRHPKCMGQVVRVCPVMRGRDRSKETHEGPQRLSLEMFDVGPYSDVRRRLMQKIVAAGPYEGPEREHYDYHSYALRDLGLSSNE